MFYNFLVITIGLERKGALVMKNSIFYLDKYYYIW